MKIESTMQDCQAREAACLLARKPSSFDDLRMQFDHPLTEADVYTLKGNAHYEVLECKEWDQLMHTDLSTARWWLVALEKEGVRILIDTQGYDYPRYVGILADQIAAD